MVDTRSIYIKIQDTLEGTYNIAEVNWLGKVTFMNPVTEIEHYHIRRIADASLWQNSAAFEITKEEAIARGYKANV